MWGAIIQAIDHALGRMQEGAGAGIKVANSNHGGGAAISNPDSGAGDAAKVAQDFRNQSNEGESEKAEAAEEAKIGSNATSTGEVPSGGEQSKGGAGPLGNIGGGAGGIGGGAGGIGGGIGDIGGGGADAGGEGAEGAADAASSVVSDENAKSAKNVSSKDNKDKEQAEGQISKWEAVRQYASNVGKGFANAGAVATGSKAAKWEDLDTSAAKKAAENTVKNWRNRDFSKSKEGK